MRRFLFCLTMWLSAFAVAQPLAFPGAEGFGKHAVGGRGGRTIIVTNLNDSGPGSLREAVEQKGSRTVVFAVSGTIELNTPLRVNNDSITIAGQTAPGDGICLKDQPLVVNGSHIIIRYIRVRLGDKFQHDNDAVSGGRYGQHDVILDHLSVSYSIDECLSIYKTKNLTVQWCLVSHSLAHSRHTKGAHGFGGIWGGYGATFHHNLLANHSSRNTRFSSVEGTKQVDMRNNVVYNWGFKSAYGGGRHGEINMVGNYYKPGPASEHHRFLDVADDGTGRYYVSGNVMEGEKKATADNWTAISNRTGFEEASLKSPVMLSTYHYDIYKTPMESAKKAYQSVLKKAGTIHRDAVEERIIRDVRQGKAEFQGETLKKAGFIDSPADAEDWPSYPEVTPEPDSDGDGMPDAWERSHGFNPQDKSDGTKVVSAEGYTALEVYLCELMGEKITIL